MNRFTKILKANDISLLTNSNKIFLIDAASHDFANHFSFVVASVTKRKILKLLSYFTVVLELREN